MKRKNNHGYVFKIMCLFFVVAKLPLSSLAQMPRPPMHTGDYHGVVKSSAENSIMGVMAIRLSTRKTFTGQALLGGKKLAFKGEFNNEDLSGEIALGKSTYKMVLKLSAATKVIDGSLADASGDIGTVAAERIAYTQQIPCPNAGSYTLATQANMVSNTNLQSAGYGYIKVTSQGYVWFSAVLPNGKKILNASRITSDGKCAMYSVLGINKATLSGLVNFRDVPRISDLDGMLKWKPTATAVDETIAMIGSYFKVTLHRTKAFNYDDTTNNVHLGVFPSANRESMIGEVLTIEATNKITVGAGSQLKVVFHQSVGFFNGEIPLPGHATAVKLSGVVLQKQGRGLGMFVDNDFRRLVALDRIIKIDITSPETHSMVVENPVVIQGSLSVKNEIVQVDAGGQIGSTDLNGNFSIESSAFPGENDLDVTVPSEGLYVSSTSIKLTYSPKSEGKGLVTPALGGSFEVNAVDSPLLGLSVQVPPNSTDEEVEISIIFQPEDTPNLPYGTVQVGSPAILHPIGHQFTAPVRISLPIQSAKFPVGTSFAGCRVLANGDNGWVELPVVSRAADHVEATVTAFIYGDIVPVVDIPLLDREIRLVTIPSGASVYLDGFNTGMVTPCSVTDVADGQRKFKLCIPGFNEVFQTVTVATSGQHLNIPLTVPVNAPAIQLDPGIEDGIEVSTTVFTVSGTARRGGQTIPGGHAVVVLNGEDSETTVDAQGRFTVVLALQPGPNSISCRVTDEQGNTGYSAALTVTSNRNQPAPAGFSTQAQTSAIGNQSVVATLTWNSSDTDVDMHIADDMGHHAWYGNLGGIPGANLDRDDTDGYGPEIFTMLTPAPGTYTLRVHYYSDHGNGPTTATLSVRIGNELVFSSSQYLYSGNNWTAYEFTIGDLEIESIKTHIDSPLHEAIFTTHDTENEVTVRVKAPDSMSDDLIKLRVKENTSGHIIDTSGVVFSSREAKLKLTKPDNYTSTTTSSPLQYEFLVFTYDGAESSPKLLIQDRSSQIRQEYVDKRVKLPAFVRRTPERTTIIGASQFIGPHFFGFNDFAQYSDFPELAVISASSSIALQLALSYPSGNKLRLTSGWRNPRRNDRVGGEVNSYHQTGSGIDFNPKREGPWLPVGTEAAPTTYLEAQKALRRLAKSLFPSPEYDVLLHGNDLHIHIERNE